jgi:hypothetical protein
MLVEQRAKFNDKFLSGRQALNRILADFRGSLRM